jgi:hypothetical protein
MRNTETLLNDLLVRWHRWAAPPTRVADTLMQDLDAVLAQVPVRLRAALQFQARNMACGAEVWTSARPVGDLAEARAALRILLAVDETRWFGPLEVKLNERGNRIGDSNPRAELSDSEVDLMLRLREEGHSYGWLRDKFEVAKSTVQDICSGRRRGQPVARIKKVMR